MAGNDVRKRNVLWACLDLWGALLDGHTELVDDERAALLTDSIGGHLCRVDGRLRRPNELRSALRTWLLPNRALAPRQRMPSELIVFLASWALTRDADALERWREAGQPRRLDPAAHIAAAAGWGADLSRPNGVLRHGYLDAEELYPDRQAGELVQGEVSILLNDGVKFGEPKLSRFVDDMRRWLTPQIAGLLEVFESGGDGANRKATSQLTRLAYVLAVGEAMQLYREMLFDPANEIDVTADAHAEAIAAYWLDPPELSGLLRLSINFPALEEATASGATDLGVDFADFRAVFRTFAETGHDFGGMARYPAEANADPAAARTASVILELAIADVRDRSALVRDKFAFLFDTLVAPVRMQAEAAKLYRVQRDLRQSDSRPGRPEAIGLNGLLHQLSRAGRKGVVTISRSSEAADVDVIDRLVDGADRYVQGRLSQPEWLLRRFEEDLPAVVAALTPPKPAKPPELSVAAHDARWMLLNAAATALVQRPEVRSGLVVAGAFADLGWYVGDEQTPERMRKLYKWLQKELHEVSDGDLRFNLAGTLTRIYRTLPLADNKAANFRMAQSLAYDSLIFGNEALSRVLGDTDMQTVSRIVGVVAGLQTALLQAAGVYVRSAETELIVPLVRPSPAQLKRRGEYARDLATTAYTYTNLAVARLEDLRRVEREGLMTAAEIDVPPTAPPSTAAMGMRTLLLWAMMHMAFPDGQQRDVVKLVPSIPGQFCRMLQISTLRKINFEDMTRIALHYSFLSGDLRHPASAARDWHPDTPEHLQPCRDGRLDVDACGRYLADSGTADAGILDVLHMKRIHDVLDEASSGRYSAWLSSYNNPRRRVPQSFRRGDVRHVELASRFRDPTIDWIN